MEAKTSQVSELHSDPKLYLVTEMDLETEFHIRWANEPNATSEFGIRVYIA